MTDRSERLAAILEEKYGITSMQELDRAIKKHGKLDITILCKAPPVDAGRKKKVR